MNQQNAETSVTDISGYPVFAHGDTGAAHVIAHALLDAGELARGRERLGAWLDAHDGDGSEWLHLQFHLGIFELGTGDWDAAYARFIAEILPAAATTEDALTDGPALLWRLALAAPGPVELPWQPLRRTALRSLQRMRVPFVELHQLLALAGAGDRDNLAAWLRSRAGRLRSPRGCLLSQAGAALRAYAEGAFAQAAASLERLAPRIPEIGGSRAQNTLFIELAAHCWTRALEHGAAPRDALAA